MIVTKYNPYMLLVNNMYQSSRDLPWELGWVRRDWLCHSLEARIKKASRMNLDYMVKAISRLIGRKITVSVSSSSKRSIQQNRQATYDTHNNRAHLHWQKGRDIQFPDPPSLVLSTSLICIMPRCRYPSQRLTAEARMKDA